METVQPYVWSCGGINILDGHEESTSKVDAPFAFC